MKKFSHISSIESEEIIKRYLNGDTIQKISETEIFLGIGGVHEGNA